MNLRWDCAVTTAKRETPTLDATLTSLAAAGWEEPLVIHDVGCRSRARRAFHSHYQLGSWGSLRTAGKMLLVQKPAAEVYLISQDDVEYTAGLREHLNNDARFLDLIEADETGVLSLYTAAPNHQPAGGWHRVDVPKRAFGALAYVFSRTSLSDFVLQAGKDSEHWQSDRWTGRWCRLQSRKYYCHSPSFARHTGYVSSLPMPVRNEEFRQCKSFAETAAAIRGREESSKSA